MPKPPKFDRQEVIEKACNLYWEKGFHATSMRHLQDVVNMRPGSIYATFGSKEGLFKETLQHYGAVSLAQIDHCLSQVDSPLVALKNFVETLIKDSLKSTSPCGVCMLAKTVSELTDENSELLDEAKLQLAAIETKFTEILTLAQEGEEIDPSKVPAELARHVQVQIMGLRSYARANNGNIPVEKLVNEIFQSDQFQG